MFSIGYYRLFLILVRKCPLKLQIDKGDFNFMYLFVCLMVCLFLVSKSVVPKKKREILQMRDTIDRMIAEVLVALSISAQTPEESRGGRI